MPEIELLDQLAEMHRTGEISPREFAQGVSDVLAHDENEEAMQAALGVRPVRPWVERLKAELREFDSKWNARQRRRAMMPGLSLAGNTPAYWKALGPGLGAVVFGIVTVLMLVLTPWSEEGVRMGTLQLAKISGLFCAAGAILCLWNLVKAATYSRALSDYTDQRVRLILKRCQEHYGPRGAAP